MSATKFILQPESERKEVAKSSGDMDLEPGKPDGKRDGSPFKNESGTKVEVVDTGKMGKKTEDAGEPLPKRILRSASKKLSLAALPAVIEIQNPNSKSVSTSRKPNVTVTSSNGNAVKKNSKTTETAKPNSSTSKEFSEPKNTETHSQSPKKGKKPTAVSNPTTKTVTGTNAIVSSKNNTPAGTKFICHEELPKIEDNCSSLDTTTDESIQLRRNPLLLSPVIRCIFGFLDIEDVKDFRFVSRDWSSAGKQELASRALIGFWKVTPGRLPIDFYSCFLNSAARFSSFEFYGYGGSWKIEDLSKFFNEQQKSIKELTFKVCEFSNEETIVKNFDISPWISKSPMVKNDVKYLTKLSIYKVDCAVPLRLLQHIKDLSLSVCRINLEAGIQINPIKLSLQNIDFYQDETLSRIRINDIVNFSSAKEIYLDRSFLENDRTAFLIDLSGNCSLESLILLGYVYAVNWKTSNWDIRYMRLDDEEFYPTQMAINELYLSAEEGGEFDLFTFPQSIEKLGIGEKGEVGITCSEPTILENLKYLSIPANNTHYSFLAHFMNCPQLTHLKFFLEYGRDTGDEIQLAVIPKAVKTLTLDRCSIDWLFGSYCFANIEKLVVFDAEINFERISKAKISVDDIIFIYNDNAEQEVAKNVVNFFNYQNPLNLCKRFFIGKLKWDEMELEDSVLNEHVDIKSAFYVFENGEKGRALDEISFYQLADIPKHIIAKDYNF